MEIAIKFSENKKSAYFIFIIFTILAVCSPAHHDVCPNSLCMSTALHFAFFDSTTQQKVIIRNLFVIVNDTDTMIARATSGSLPPDSLSFVHHYKTFELSSRDSNYYVDGGVGGTYAIVVHDSIYGDFSIENIKVEQSREYPDCTGLPGGVHMKIELVKPVGLGKKAVQGRYIIQEQYIKASC